MALYEITAKFGTSNTSESKQYFVLASDYEDASRIFKQKLPIISVDSLVKVQDDGLAYYIMTHPAEFNLIR